MPASPPPQIIALAGPTASGKSGAAQALAQRFDAEIINVDSALVYRGLDIGTAKPTAAERVEVPHHLLDVRELTASYSAAEFAADARRRTDEIRGRGRRVLLVGGTMLYFKALFEGLDALPPADPAVRAVLEEEAATAGWPAMHRRLAEVDAVTAARLAPGDAQRIQRALEVWELTGRPLSALHGADRGPGLQPDLFLSLEPQDRAWLHDRIARRFDAMLAAGLVDEVQALRARGDLHLGLPSMRCVGYRQLWEGIDAGQSLAQMRERGIAATRQLAKRQLTWLRGMPQRQVVACDGADPLAVLSLALEGPR